MENTQIIYSTTYTSPIGEITLASDYENIVGLWFEDQKYYLSKYKLLIPKDDLPIFFSVKNWLNCYFNKEKPDINELNIKPIGSEFQKTVWKLLIKIPYGTTTTYGEISKQAAKILSKQKMSAQAIGSAVGHNPISIIIPCHRVIGTNGKLTGYAGGIERKKHLLKLENDI